MIPWNELGRAPVGKSELVLAKRGDEFSIRMRGAELMNSRLHGSEDLLGKLGCDGLAKVAQARVLVGGLGMGFTARAALDALNPEAKVTIVELVPEVVTWNREILGDLARRPLDDPRVTVKNGDVTAAIADASTIPAGLYHAILLDVDNGPDAFTAPSNAALYGLKGLLAAKRALVVGGALAVWSVEDDKKFTDRMKGAGFDVDRQKVPSRPGSNIKHVIWVGRRRR